MKNTITIVPAAPGFYALFLNPEELKIPRQFFCHAVTAWQIYRSEDVDGNVTAHSWPICAAENGGGYDFILQPNGSLVHVTGFTCETMESALGFALDQETMFRRNCASLAAASGSSRHIAAHEFASP
jgi:hypothetical protein